MTRMRRTGTGATQRIGIGIGVIASLGLGLGTCTGHALAGPSAFEAAQTVEKLSAGLPNWHSTELLASWRDPAGASASGTLRRTERFNVTDSQTELGGTLPLAPRWRAEAELTVSETHRVLPAWQWRGRIWREGIAGWNFALGAGRTLHSNPGLTQGSATAQIQAERYLGPWRFAMTGAATRLDGAGVSSSHVWRLDWYASETLSVGALLAFGRELENIPGRGVLSSSVRGAALSANYAWAPNWQLSAQASAHRQGDFYERNGLRIGVRYQH
jgi:YaiO family outer membrane protein